MAPYTPGQNVYFSRLRLNLETMLLASIKRDNL
jgi:hypothetical protein